MGYNPFLPCAVARINVLCVPAGPITPDRFQKFLKLLQRAATGIPKALRSPENAEGAATESNEDRIIFYDVSATENTERPHLFPFENNSRYQILLGLVDGERIATQSPAFSGEDSASPVEVPVRLESIEAQFAEQPDSHTGLVLRRLVLFGSSLAPSVNYDGIAFLSEAEAERDARGLLATLSSQFGSGAAAITNDLKDQPISMVPGGGSQPHRRGGPAPNLSERSSTPISAKPPSPLPSTTPEQQSDTSRGRFKVVEGMFYLQAGKWSDALTSLSEGASIAQGGHDHLWHAKALECLLVGMVLLSWAGKSFTAPQACRSLPNRSGAFRSEASLKPGESLKILAQLMPPIVETVLELYARVSNLDLGGSLQDVLRESRVRVVNLLIFVKRNRGLLTMQSLDHIVLGHDDKPEQSSQIAGEAVAISKAGLANILIETLQESQSSNNISHHTTILVAVASSLSTLTLERKHAFYIKQLMQRLVPKLIEARKVGASEVGVHPAAGLPPLNNALLGAIPEMLLGTRTLLNLAAGAYGVPLGPVPQPRKLVTADLVAIHARLAIWANERMSGDTALKLEMLRTCVAVCEALPDIAAGLHFTANIFRGATQVVTMPRYHTTDVPLISAEEQTRLLDSIKRAVTASSRVGAEACRAEYWDDFLVRDVQLFERDSFARLSAHKPSDLSLRGGGLVDTVRDPFIYNPFSKDKSVSIAPVLVAGESAAFAVLLQNPLEVEIEIDEIRLLSHGCGFIPSKHSIVLGPFSTQLFSLNGTPTESGDLEITGCRASIRNCYDQEFLIFRDEWKLPLAPKQNAIGRVKFKSRRATEDAAENTHEVDLPLNPPMPTPLALKVISPQPRLQLTCNALVNPAIMLLEGESRTFEMTLTNQSTSVRADLVLVTIEDSVTTRLQEALSSKDLNPTEVYEIQHQLAAHPAADITGRQEETSEKGLEPGQSIAYSLTVFGRPGLVSATVQTDYAFLGSPSSEVQGTFYTRQVRFPVSVTVNGSVEIPRCNILPIHGDFGWNARPDVEDEDGSDSDPLRGKTDGSELAEWLQTQSEASRYCMLSIDLRNVWPQPLNIEIRALKWGSSTTETEQAWEDAHAVCETLQPGHVTRTILLVPRLFIDDPHSPIPNLDTQKQFVVSSSKLSAEVEAATRESFWYREELLKYLRGTWREEKSGRHGEIDLRKGVRLSPRMVDALKVDHVEIEYRLKPLEEAQDRNQISKATTVKQTGRSHFEVATESFATLSVMIHNHTQETLRLLLRLQPALRNQAHNVALDLSKRFAWSGVLQRALHPAIEPGGTCVAELGIIALAQGDYEINASVEEMIGRRGQGGAKPEAMAVAASERRMWHARSPCLIDAVDA